MHLARSPLTCKIEYHDLGNGSFLLVARIPAHCLPWLTWHQLQALNRLHDGRLDIFYTRASNDRELRIEEKLYDLEHGMNIVCTRAFSDSLKLHLNIEAKLDVQLSD
jgi:hypothetical protein